MMTKITDHLSNKTAKTKLAQLLLGLLFSFSVSVQSATLVGTTKGSLSVDQGVAQFSVPIKVPEGVSGMMPELALNYSSAAGDNFIGVGWSLGGLSAIGLCPQTLAQDNRVQGVRFAAEDKFCMDGVRLVAINGEYGADGTEYRTETETFSRVTSYGSNWYDNSSSWFEVETKSGQTFRYGGTSSARDSLNDSNIYAWYLDQITDSGNNVITINYKNSGGKRYPFSITYGVDASIEFFYEDRPVGDTSIGYLRSKVLESTERLDRIEVKQAGETYRKYEIDYKPVADVTNAQSLVSSITECVYGGECYEAFQFGWNNKPTGELFAVADVRTSSHPFLENGSVGQVGDFNGDQVNDFYVISKHNNVLEHRIAVTEQWNDDNYFFDIYDNPPPIDLTEFSTENEASSRIKVGDFNGDGRSDFYVIKGGKSSRDEIWLAGEAVAGVNSGYIKINGIISSIGTGDSKSVDLARFKFGDFDGDRRTDIYYVRGRGETKEDTIYLSNGNGTYRTVTGLTTEVGSSASRANIDLSRIQIADFNSDGMSDVYYVRGWGTKETDTIYYFRNRTNSPGEDFYYEVSSGIRSSIASNSTDAGIDISRIKFGHFNKDGLLDIYHVGERGAATTDTIHLSKGNGTYVNVGGLSTPVSANDERAKVDVARIMPIDFNGDGVSDIYYVNGWGGEAVDTVHLFDGIDSFTEIDGANSRIENNSEKALKNLSGLHFGDYTGDGKIDLFERKLREGDTSYASNPDGYWINSNVGSVITDFTNGFGVHTKLEYGYLLNTADSNLISEWRYPFVRGGKAQVVKRQIVDNDAGGTTIVSYKYGNALIHQRGRGHQGYDWVEQYNDTTKRKLVMSRHQTDIYDIHSEAFPFQPAFTTAAEYLTRTDEAGYRSDTIISRSTTWSSYESVYPGVHIGNHGTTLVETFDDNGDLLKTVSTEYLDYDDYGNAREVNVVTEGGGELFSVLTRNTYYNDNGEWILGRLTDSQVTHVNNAGETITRYSHFKYRMDNGWLEKEFINYGSPLALTKTYSYDTYGNQIQVISSGASEADGSGVTTRQSEVVYFANKRDVQFKRTNYGQFEEEFAYHARCGMVEYHWDWNRQKTTYEYDNACNKVKEIRPDGTFTQWINEWSNEIDLSGDVTLSRVSTSGQREALTYFNKFGKPIREETTNIDGRPIRVEIDYDGRGLEKYRTTPHLDITGHFIANSRRITTKYDEFGRVSEVWGSTPHSSYTWRDDGELLQAFDYDGFNIIETSKGSLFDTVKTTTKNAIDQVVRIDEEEGAWVTYAYNAAGQLEETNANGTITTLVYDEDGNKEKMIDPSMGTWEYGYNAFGELKWQKDAKNQTTTMVYDGLGRMTRRIEPEGETVWVYDEGDNGNKAKGKLFKVTSPGGYSENYTYDSKFLPWRKSISTALDGSYDVTTTYDNYSRPEVMTYPGGLQVKNIYNTHGFLSKVQSKTTSVYETIWEFKKSNSPGRVTEEYYGNGHTTSHSFGVGSGEHLTSLSTVQYNEYRYDKNYNVEWRKDHKTGMREDFEYDRLHRLEKTTTTGVAAGINFTHAVDYTYHENGNIKSNSDLGTYSYGNSAKSTNLAGPHAMLGVGSSMTDYSYDANGNAERANGAAVKWNSYNKPTEFKKGTNQTNFYYGANRARYLKVTNNSRTVYFDKLYEKFTSGNEVKHKNYIYVGGKLVSAHQTSTKAGVAQEKRTDYFHLDNLGSTVAVTDKNGGLVERMGYAAFGERRFASGEMSLASIIPTSTNRGFTGHEHIEGFGLVHMNGRVYDPKAGRFLSADPHIQDGGNSQSYNRYTYVLNNPLKYTDPSGFFFKALKKLAKKAFKAAMKITGLDAAYNFVKKNPWAQSLLMVAVNFIPGCQSWCGALASAALSAAFTKINGGSWGDALKAGAVVLASAGLANEVAALTDGMHIATVSATHGAAQGALAELTGGDFRSAAIGAFAAHMSKGMMMKENGSFMDIQNRGGLGAIAGRTAVASAVGGFSAKLGGGKFKNGAITGAFVHMYNGEREHLKSKFTLTVGAKGTPLSASADTDGNVGVGASKGGVGMSASSDGSNKVNALTVSIESNSSGMQGKTPDFTLDATVASFSYTTVNANLSDVSYGVSLGLLGGTFEFQIQPQTIRQTFNQTFDWRTYAPPMSPVRR